MQPEETTPAEPAAAISDARPHAISDEVLDAPKSRISYTQIKRFINGLGPDTELYSGRKFFTMLLRKRGIDGVLDFIERASVALSDGTELDPFYDMNAIEREILGRTPFDKLNRRAFLSVYPGMAFAIIEGAYSAGKLGKQSLKLSGILNPEPGEKPQTAVEIMNATLPPIAGLAISIVVGNEMLEVIREMKLEQIKDAVGELNKQLPEDVRVPSNAEMVAFIKQLGDKVETLKQRVDEQNAELASLKGRSPG